MLTVVTWKWPPHVGYRSTFSAETVNTLRAMVRRHYPRDHRFVCVTNEPDGIGPDVKVLPAWDDYAQLQSPHGTPKNPSCYRRLRLFHPEAEQWFGPRFVSLDLDLVITGDLTALWDRSDDLVLCGDTNPRTHYNGSMLLMTAGARPQVWTDFQPDRSPQQAMRSGNFGSDQGWISYCLGGGEAKWTTDDGVFSFRNHLAEGRTIPDHCRVVLFHGRHDPWEPYVQSTYPWVRRHYRAEAEVAA